MLSTSLESCGFARLRASCEAGCSILVMKDSVARIATARGITEVCTARADAARAACLTHGFKPFV
jgi:hypothetical protein